jgi:hypothetical protein
MRKRRTGWCSMSTGGGSYNSPNVKDDAASDADDDSDDDDDGDEPRKPKRSIQKLSNEAARRRRENRELKAENDRLKAQLADDGKATGTSDSTRADFILALAEAGLKRDRIRAATKLVDLDEFDDVEDAIEELKAEHPFLFGPESNDDEKPKTGRTAPSMNNGRRKPGKETEEQRRIRLSSKYPALQGRWSPR